MAPDYSVNTKGLAFESTWEFLIMYTLTFACVILFVILFKIHFVHILWNLCQLYIFTGIFVQPLHIGHIIIGLYWAARETGQFQVPVPKAQDNKPKKYHHHEMYIWTRIKHDTCWSYGMTPYLHPHLPNDPKEKKF